MIDIRLTGALYDEVVRDLSRPHPFAAERVGFVFGRIGSLRDSNKVILLNRYHSIPDAHYVNDPTVGARIGPEAMTRAMQDVYHGRTRQEGIFHIHLHGHKGPPGVSGVDSRDLPGFIPGFKSAGRQAAHGIVIFSEDHGSGWVWLPSSHNPVLARAIVVVGSPLQLFLHDPRPHVRRTRTVTPWQRFLEFSGRLWTRLRHRQWFGRLPKEAYAPTPDRYSRQSFLGPDAEERIASSTVGVVGLGGGGSHIVQQLAHLGFQRYVLYDYDAVEDSNLNRLVGAVVSDVPASTPKLQVAKRMILSLQPNATIRECLSRWQDSPLPLRDCQIVFGCVDSFKERYELEVACRRYLVHYIDIGMDVHGTGSPVIGGQAILSSPGSPCMKCMGFLTDTQLAQEAGQYGNAGHRPQVVWSNGILASTAVGMAVDLVAGWTRRRRPYEYVVYDGNEGTIKESLSVKNLKVDKCPHFPDNEAGDPIPVQL